MKNVTETLLQILTAGTGNEICGEPAESKEKAYLKVGLRGKGSGIESGSHETLKLLLGKLWRPALSPCDGIEVFHGITVTQVERCDVGAVFVGPVDQLFHGLKRSGPGLV